MLNEKTIESIIDNDYRDFARYTVENRAIPSMVDGLKPSQRKALYCGIMDAKKFVKTIALVGSTLSKANYHHGDSSMSGTISLMAADWANNLPLFEGEGNFGNRLVKQASAPRYTSVKLSDTFKEYFLDNDILPENIDPENPEPKHYLPMIPWVLVNGVAGIAVGFACEIQPRAPEDLLKAVQTVLKGKVLKDDELPPSLPQFVGDVFRDEEGRWIQQGKFERESKTSILITEVPTDTDRLKFVTLLDKLEEENKIHSYTELTSKKQRGFRYRIQLKRKTEYTDEQLIRLFKLRSVLSENLTVLDSEGHVKHYESTSELVRDWVAYRLTWIKKRYEVFVQNGSEKLDWLRAKAGFLSSVLDGDIIFRNSTKENLIESMNECLGERIVEKYGSRLLSLSLLSMSKEEMDKLNNEEIPNLEADIETWKGTDSTEAFLNDLEKINRT